MTFFLQGLHKPQWTDFADLDWRHTDSMHELIDEEGLGNMNLKRFLLPNAVSVWHSENTKWLSLPQYPRQPAATWSTSNCAVQFQSACFWCRGPRCSISADWKYLTENQESVAIGPIASSNVSPFGSVSLACGFGIVRSLWPLGRNAFMDAWTWTLCWIRQYLCFLLCLHRPIRKARCHV